MLKILVVEDEDIIRQGIIDSIDFDSLGYELIGEAQDGEEALAFMDKCMPDVIVTDIKMPFMDGLTMLERVLPEHPDTYVVILSGHDEFEYARKALKLNAFEYILKPLKVSHLISTLSEIKKDYDKKEEQYKKIQALKEIEVKGKWHLKERILYNLILAETTVEYEAANIELLGREIMDQYYAIAIVDIKNLVQQMIEEDYLAFLELDQELGEQLKKIVRGFNYVTIWKKNNCERILCLEGNSEQELIRRKERVGNLLKQVGLRDFEPVITFGNMCKGPQELECSYRNAIDQKNSRCLKTYGKVLYGSPEEKDTGKFIDFDEAELLTEIRVGNQKGIRQQLLKFQEAMVNHNIKSALQIVMVVSNIYFSIIKLPAEADGKLDEVLPDAMEQYNRLLQQLDTSQLVFQLEGICFKIADYLSRLTQGKFAEVLKHAEAYIAKHYNRENLMLKDVARASYVSSSYLSIILKQEKNITFIEYLTEIRMKRAQELLRETNLKSYQVAQNCGYSNPTYFSTIFKKIYGMTPSEYRRSVAD